MSKEISTLAKKIKSLYDQIFEIKDEDDQQIYPIFHVVPDKKTYPDYYDIVSAPTSLNSIKKRYPHYSTPNEFIKDLAQIVWNAKTYNESGSFVYKYAEKLDQFIKETVIPKFAKQGYDVGYPDTTNILPTKAGALIAYGTPVVLLNSPSTPMKVEKDTDLRVEYERPKRRAAAAATAATASSNATSIATSTTSSTISHTTTPSTPSTTYNKEQSYKRGRPPVIDKPFEQRIKNVLRVLRKEKALNGQIITLPFERLPDIREYPDYFNAVNEPISLDEIRKKIKQRKYKDVQGFINDFNLMLSNAKFYNEKESPVYKQTAQLEQLFRKNVEAEMKKPDSDYIAADSLKVPLDQLELHGSLFKIGDWILINNPNDSAKPIVAQLFRIWQTQDGQRWINVCWYLRPEQTVHRVDRLFYENEVVKSGQYRDHLADEIVGKCYVAYFTRYQRGDPALKIEGPLFICEYRYNDNDKNFNKIRTWKACLPDEVRDIEDPITPLPSLRRFKKFESPIKHLLPSNASLDMSIPEPKIGTPNAPPIHGAVYLRDIDETDDLGQYSTSRVCPKYIIRPNDPPPTDSPSQQTAPIVNYTRNIVSVSHQHSNLYHAIPTYVPTTTASSFTIPVNVKGQDTGLIKMDHSNNKRRLTGITEVTSSEGPVIWFRAPGVHITSRTAPQSQYVSFNKIIKRTRNEDEENEKDEDDEYVTSAGNGIAGQTRIGHSAKYLAWKLAKLRAPGDKKQKKNVVV